MAGGAITWQWVKVQMRSPEYSSVPMLESRWDHPTWLVLR